MEAVSKVRANIQTFKRIEKKFILMPGVYEKLMDLISENIKTDAFGISDIRSLYLDTPTSLIVRRSQMKPVVYKEKVRIRSYGAPKDHHASVFLELKKKFKGIVYKRRLRMPLSEAEAFAESRLWPASVEDNVQNTNAQILREIGFTLDRYIPEGGLHPSMLISSQRQSFVGKEDSGLRLTFDQDVLWRQDALSLMEPLGGTPLLDAGAHLLEVKAAGTMPVWLANALSISDAKATSFSKYGNAYLASLASYEKSA
ncbi:MAG: polyphosphate polymerase domain-containing protein [Coriobacteriales bacterium]|nr:polyphosphate polymerase domain-containing protein [Coriobacteriales bacterium]